MFDIGFWEIVVVLIIALIVVGPEKLPGLARNVGLWIAMAQRKIAEVRGEVERELNIHELRRSVAQPEALQEMRQLAERVKSLHTEIQADVRRATLLNAESLHDASVATSPPPTVVNPPPLAPGETPLAESAEPTPITDAATTDSALRSASPLLATVPVTPGTSPDYSHSLTAPDVPPAQKGS